MQSNLFKIDVLQKISVRNFIPLLYGVDKFQQMNEFDTNQKASSAQDKQINFNQFTSLLFLPTSVAQLSILQKEVKQEIYDVNKYFKEFQISEFDLVQITFSPLIQKSFNEKQQNLNIIQISKVKKFKKIHEINELLDQMREKFLQYFSHPVEIQPYENLYKQNSQIKEIQTYTTQETTFKITNDQTDYKEKNETADNTKQDAISGLCDIDQFESNHFQQQNKKEKQSTDQQINLSLSSKKSSEYTSKSNSINFVSNLSKQLEPQEQPDKKFQDDNDQQDKYFYEQNLQDYYQGYNCVEYLDDQQEMQFRGSNEDSKNIQMNYELSNIDPSSNIQQFDYPIMSDQNFVLPSSHQHEKLIILSPKNPGNDVSATMQSHIQFINSPRFGQELQSPLTTNKDNEQSHHYFISQNVVSRDNNLINSDINLPNLTISCQNHLKLIIIYKQQKQNSQSLSQAIIGSQASPTIKIQDILKQSTIDDKSNNQITHAMPFLVFKNNEQLKKIQDSSMDQYTQSHTSIEQEIKNNIQAGNKVTNSKFLINHQLSRKEIQLIEKNVSKLYEVQNSKKFIKENHNINSQLKDQQSQHLSEQGNQESEQNGQKNKRNKNDNDNQEYYKIQDSQFYSKKQFLYEMIAKRQEPIQIKYASQVLRQWMGLFQKYGDRQILLFNLIELQNNQIIQGSDILECYSQIVRQKELLYTINKQGLVGIDENDQIIMKLQKEERDFRQIQLRQLIHLFQDHEISKGFEKYMLEDLIQVSFLTNQNQPLKFINFTRIYSLINMPLYLRSYVMMNDFDSQTYVLENYQNMVDMLSTIVQNSSDMSNQKINSSKNLLYLSIFLIESCSGFILLLIFPIYYIIQSRSEEILKLMVSFDSNFLNKTIQKYSNELQNQQNISTTKTLRSIKTIKNLETKNILSLSNIVLGATNSYLKQSDRKRKVISQTDKLQKFSNTLTLKSLIVFIIISIYSIANFTLTRNFFETFNYNISEVSQIYEIKSLLSLEFTCLGLFTNSYIYNFNSRDLEVLQIFKEQFIDAQLFKWTTELYKIEENFQVERNHMEEYKTILLKTVKEDACQILRDSFKLNYQTEEERQYQEINQSYDSKVNANLCDQILKGKIKQGLIVSLKELNQQFNQVYAIFNSTLGNDVLFFQQFDQWCKESNYFDLQQSYYYIRQIIRLLKEKSHASSKNYFEYIKRVQLGLCLYIIVICIIIFIFLWTKFVDSLSMKIFQVRFFLSLIPLENLLENSYIISYLNKQIRYQTS